MIHRAYLLFAAVLCAGTANLSAQANLSETRATLDKWVETRQLIARIKADWQADKETLDHTGQLVSRELKAVQEQKSKLTTNSATAQKEWAENEQLKNAAAGGLDKARQFATTFEAKIVKLVPRLPVPLQDILRPLLARLPADAATTKLTPSERVQVVVGILNEVDKFNSAVTVFSEKRKNDAGEEVAVETVYIGLGATYFVNESGDFAGMGSPGAAGWEWSNKPELATPVRDVVRIYRNERPARFIPLPASIR